MKFLVILISGVLFASCGVSKRQIETNKVQYKGALKNMMHLGDLSAKADLMDFKKIKHLYALGAIENLKGEVQIFDSEPYNTIVIDKRIAYDKSYHKKAALFVYAVVPKWTAFNIPENINSYQELEVYIAQIASKNHIDILKPFPFLIEGKCKSFDWHVIDWKDGDTEHSHEKHIQSGLFGTAHEQDVNMLGFYSDSHHAIFTHHTTNMHIHVKTMDNKIAGHVDGLSLGKGMVLKLPKTN